MKILYFVVPMLISLLLEFPLKTIARKLGLYAKENERTVHHGQIPRVGGIAIYIAFIVGVLLFIKDSITVRAFVIGGTIIFAEGLLDDIFDVSPLFKIVFQFAAASVLVFMGNMNLRELRLPFNLIFNVNILGYIITYLWIIGITNAVNLLDGLDGLAGGFCVITLITISLISTTYNMYNVYMISMVLAGSTMGFLFHNFHPASIFMGDCGAQFLGFMIAAISLYGYKSATFITLAIPIILLFVPIFDTFSAILRRKLNHQPISSPDKKHFHHILMNNLSLGQTGATITIYIITAIFGITAYIYINNTTLGLLILLLLVMIFEIFIEYTGMISTSYRPILNLLDKIAKKHYRAEDETKSDE
ncbi:MAG: undecaprenyl/decaprenyl-phosphate alpha-N-acetylglucosaminyl 1-phosphate transferase [Erysipelotrichaceae bacterium]|nr:undecaprenyl/decaprenyl-phosphate alpha-N-acetylglucosaminyl 1-phosphate transferase [Erysipelotrichaceae bacterium]